MNYSLLENNLAPFIIKKEEKNTYMQILGEAQIKKYPSDSDVEKFIQFAKPIMEEEKREYLYLPTKIQSKYHKSRKPKRKKKDVTG